MPAFNPAYVGPRQDILRLVPDDARRVLDVGCSVGVLGQSIKQRQPATVVGVELDAAMAAEAKPRLDRTIVGSVEEASVWESLAGQSFDCLIFADLLEHLRDPWAVLGRFVDQLEPGGTAIASLPNVRHYTTLLSLGLGGRWPYRDRGIHDRTHLRFFALPNVRELFESAGLEVQEVRRNYRIVERPHRLNRLAGGLALPGLRELFAFQYLVRGAKPR